MPSVLELAARSFRIAERDALFMASLSARLGEVLIRRALAGIAASPPILEPEPELVRLLSVVRMSADFVGRIRMHDEAPGEAELVALAGRESIRKTFRLGLRQTLLRALSTWRQAHGDVIDDVASDVGRRYLRTARRMARAITVTLKDRVATRLREALRTGVPRERFVDWLLKQEPRFTEDFAREVFQAGVREANGAGRARKALELRARLGGFRYFTVGDDRVRVKHKAWHRTVFPMTRKGLVWWPPNSFNCRCWAVPVDRRTKPTPGWELSARPDFVGLPGVSEYGGR